MSSVGGEKKRDRKVVQVTAAMKTDGLTTELEGEKISGMLKPSQQDKRVICVLKTEEVSESGGQKNMRWYKTEMCRLKRKAKNRDENRVCSSEWDYIFSLHSERSDSCCQHQLH